MWRITVLSLVVGVGVWVAHVAIESAFFSGGPFLDWRILNPSGLHVLYALPEILLVFGITLVWGLAYRRKMIRDISELKFEKEGLAEEYSIRTTLIGALPYPTMLVHRDRTVLFANKVAQEIGAVVGGQCWEDFGQCQFISDEDKACLNQHSDRPPGWTHCTFCLADQALRDAKGAIAPEVHAFGRIWETYWIPVNKDVFLHFSLDITDRKKAEEEQSNLAKFPSENPNPVLRISKDYRIIYANQASSPVLDFWGCKEGEVLPELCAERARGAFQLGEITAFDFNCGERVFSVILAPVHGADYLNAYAHDITERKKAEVKATRHLAEMKFLSMTAMEFVDLQPETDIYELIGRRLKELVGDPIVVISSSDETNRKVIVRAILGVGKRFEAALKVLGRNPVGMSFPILESFLHQTASGKLVKLSEGIHHYTREKISKTTAKLIEKILGLGDMYSMQFFRAGTMFAIATIMMRKGDKLENPALVETYINHASVLLQNRRAEEQIAASLKEKEVLLREIHHRVKNNMQVIVSLLRIHARRTHEAGLKRIFDECRDRINAMSLIHEALYESEDVGRIDFEAYLTMLCRNLRQAYDVSEKGITLTVKRSNVALDIDQGIAVGMVISELVSNAFKHAFTKDKGGSVSLSLSGLEGKEVELIVQDDGKGLPPEIDIHNSTSIGLQLVVATITRELGGSIEVERDSGTRFVIRFICPNPQQRETPCALQKS